jgi:uncharacterized protein DUF6247
MGLVWHDSGGTVPDERSKLCNEVTAMTAEARNVSGQGAPFLAPPSKDLKSIRAALPAEDQGDFDADFQVVMAEATATMDLAGISAFIERWWRIAWSAGHLAEHRAMLERADQLRAGAAVHTTPWAQTRSDRGL